MQLNLSFTVEEKMAQRRFSGRQLTESLDFLVTKGTKALILKAWAELEILTLDDLEAS